LKNAFLEGAEVRRRWARDAFRVVAPGQAGRVRPWKS